ncbi:hypothetical protein PITCH_A190027 [uncultured Desulfobacterium sp.]|uniref:Lipopolysaccharide assembly protein A domain-containing protein n=1 Tax=uncultured Desulfobacterium sp. TaxID=201089 RepID=A0A445MVR7_9BACT|nr:hypothetical protein PITCH_A190027 [uncultured Desulfobacterium sp.]
MKYIKVLLISIVLVLAFVVAVQNYENLKTPLIFSIDLIFYRYESPKMSLASITVVAFLTGLIFMGLYGAAERFRMKKLIRSLREELRSRDKEFESIRNLSAPYETVQQEKVAE